MTLKKVHKSIYILVFLLVSFTGYSQRESFAGILLNTSIYPDQISLNKLSIGAIFETRFRNHGGVETGFFYRTDRSTEMVTYTDVSGTHSHSFTIARRYINIPVLYKYFSNEINLSIGPAFDIYLGWKQKNDGSPYKVESYNVNRKLKIGLLSKVGKTFLVNQSTIIEPELRLASIQGIDKINLGIGIAVKHKF